ncbi:M23 family metallopeptidase [Candidatus Nomurabacteria bacterium]|nr:M23 family metallopeptidase [Candidatus Nomurabacteria bacterium]MCB9819166.1 M23 family metallopeptidase [Candidatus Nomurabacteria bacterium]
MNRSVLTLVLSISFSPAVLAEDFHCPVASCSGIRQNGKGLDIAVAKATFVHAVESGEVIFADRLKQHGMTIIIRHNNGGYSSYGQLETFLVGTGVRVGQGKKIAVKLPGPPLYFELTQLE